MKELTKKIGIAVFGGIVLFLAASTKTYPENAKMAGFLVGVLGIFLAILDEKLRREAR